MHFAHYVHVHCAIKDIHTFMKIVSGNVGRLSSKGGDGSNTPSSFTGDFFKQDNVRQFLPRRVDFKARHGLNENHKWMLCALVLSTSAADFKILQYNIQFQYCF